jgi:hypothetical protein
VKPPVIDPSFSNGNNTAYWDNEAVKLPTNYQWTFSVQRQLAGTIVLEAPTMRRWASNSLLV